MPLTVSIPLCVFQSERELSRDRSKLHFYHFRFTRSRTMFR